MKKYAALIILLFLATISYAQKEEVQNRKQSNSFILYKDIPKNLKIQDKVILVNKTNYFIGQIAVAVRQGIEDFTSVGSLTDIVPGKSYHLASYDNERLRAFRGKKLAVKIKGIKTKSSIDEKDADINLDVFDISLYEKRHDLYIVINYNGSFFDF